MCFVRVVCTVTDKSPHPPPASVASDRATRAQSSAARMGRGKIVGGKKRRRTNEKNTKRAREAVCDGDKL